MLRNSNYGKADLVDSGRQFCWPLTIADWSLQLPGMETIRGVSVRLRTVLLLYRIYKITGVDSRGGSQRPTEFCWRNRRHFHCSFFMHARCVTEIDACRLVTSFKRLSANRPIHYIIIFSPLLNRPTDEGRSLRNFELVIIFSSKVKFHLWDTFCQFCTLSLFSMFSP